MKTSVTFLPSPSLCCKLLQKHTAKGAGQVADPIAQGIIVRQNVDIAQAPHRAPDVDGGEAGEVVETVLKGQLHPVPAASLQVPRQCRRRPL